MSQKFKDLTNKDPFQKGTINNKYGRQYIVKNINLGCTFKSNAEYADYFRNVFGNLLTYLLWNMLEIYPSIMTAETMKNCQRSME